ncbi:MAG: hypothetical protein Q4C52_09420 [Eubacteriales bacterium]|nr:hypothetical protein [Eubacteriales bacterium]
MRNFLTCLATAFMILLAGTALFLCSNAAVYNLAYIFSFLFIAFYAVFAPSTIPSKLVQVILYALIMTAQILFNTLVIRTMSGSSSYNLYKLVGVLVISASFIVRANFFHQTAKTYGFPSGEGHSAISYAQLLYNKEEIIGKINKIKKAGGILSQIELTEIMHQLPRHSSFSYVNNGTLTEEYFQKANETVENGFVYIVVTKSKSLSSDVIGLFTEKEYNHVSLSFDEQLMTIISYNGGKRAVPPGLNEEWIENLTQRNGSVILVYRLPASAEQKEAIIRKIRQINSEGSAYNLLGLVFKESRKPNIMFCSQFVYTMLKFAGLNYFDKKAAQVTPSDFIELDYGRKLEFVRKITLDNMDLESDVDEK